MLKSRETYEIITPEEIGLTRADEAGIVLGAQLTGILLALQDPQCLPASQHAMPQASAMAVISPIITFLSISCLRAGKHSGRNALRTKLSQMGYDLAQEDLNDVFKRFKVLSPLAFAACHRDTMLPMSSMHGHCALQPDPAVQLR